MGKKIQDLVTFEIGVRKGKNREKATDTGAVQVRSNEGVRVAWMFMVHGTYTALNGD